MPEFDEERLAVATEVRQALAIENTLSPIQARAFVRSLQMMWQVPLNQWRDRESREQLADARRLLHAAEIFRKIEGADSAGALACYRRAGEILEWLSRARDKLGKVAPLELLAAASFQLGGLPAMATGLLGQVALEHDGLKLYARFLKADFDGVIDAVATFWQHHPELTDRAAPARLLDREDPDTVSWHFTVELVRTLGLVADSLRRGDDRRLDRAITKLDALDRMATRTFSEDASLLVALMRSVADNYRAASIYGPIGKLAEINPERRPKLERFARGQFKRGRGILWSSQRAGLDRLLRDSSFAMCTPTGSGKTLVANLALVKELMLPEDAAIAPMALYLVPSRALAGEVEAKLRSELGQDMIITGLYGGADWGITDYWLRGGRPTVLIATVEKADALMRYVGPLLIARLKLLIIDEAHQVVAEDDERTRDSFSEHSCRSLRLEGFVARLLSRAPDLVRIALTAVAGGASASVARWIEGRDNAEAIGTRYRSTRQVIGVFETAPERAGQILLDIMNGRTLWVRGRERPVYLPLGVPPMPRLSATMRNSLYRFNELTVLWTSLHLVEGERRILISVAQEPEQTMRWFRDALALPAWQSIPAFVLPQGALRDRFDEARATAVDYCGEHSHEVVLLDRGIATNHGQMPQRLRRLMTEMIDLGICPITVATATLTEGVNLPFDLIFLTSLRRTSFDQDQGQIVIPLSTAEFRNLAGRAGRPGATKGMEGLTLVAVPQMISTTADGFTARQTAQRQTIERDYYQMRTNLLAEEEEGLPVTSPLALLLEAIAERALEIGIDGGQFLDWLEEISPGDISDDAGRASTGTDARLADSLDELDGILLSALEELGQAREQPLDGAEAEAQLAALWQRTFTRVAADQEAWLEQAFIRRGRALIETIYPDNSERQRLYQYGFTPFIGQRFEQVAPTIREHLQAAIDYGRMTDAERLKIFRAIGTLLVDDPGFGFRARATVTEQTLLRTWDDVLAWWLQAPHTNVPNADALRSWQKFVSENLEFRLGVAIGGVVAQAWSAGADDPLAVPSLDLWCATTGLPWFGFWARELLRWGTLDPFVAFALAQGLSRTRDGAAARRPDFVAWLAEEETMDVDELPAEILIDPQQFLLWQRSLAKPAAAGAGGAPESAELTGTDGHHGRYSVIPVRDGDAVRWFDPAGYELAISREPIVALETGGANGDFELTVRAQGVTVSRTFA